MPGIEREFNLLLSKLLGNSMHQLMTPVTGTEIGRCGVSFRAEVCNNETMEKEIIM
jgi:hypothetical protein